MVIETGALRAKEDPIAWVQQKAAEALQRLDQKMASQPVQMYLPGFDLGAFPNHVNRSSLFAPIARGRRKFHRQTKMVSRSDAVIEYTGEQLDEADCDLMMALIWFAQKKPLGEWVTLNRAQLLRRIGRATGKQNYEWLHRRMRAMTEATLYIEVRKSDGSTRYKIGYAEAFHLISGFAFDEKSDEYCYQLDPRWVQLFSNREYSLINFDLRLQIKRGQDMAKTLQRLVATSSDPIQSYELEWLKSKMEYTGRMRDFKESLSKACNELKRLHIVSEYKITLDKKKQRELLKLWIPKAITA
ncbi:hypothetical protein HPTL_P063 (plasmid) [Hydrogenophilus thermoluteolus]|uniref:Uncharacterized protein n=1 Tax=Hydrogenophilus thermoluteolus TaxID=297 RepID=A0A2Z6E185_HYDTE|nr:hypothetical protein HPTL_P063 [Hydrogenophilus thermoluteolus]